MLQGTVLSVGITLIFLIFIHICFDCGRGGCRLGVSLLHTYEYLVSVAENLSYVLYLIICQ